MTGERTDDGGLTDAETAAALRGHLSGVTTTTETVLAGMTGEGVTDEELSAALTEAEELAALLRELQ